MELGFKVNWVARLCCRPAREKVGERRRNAAIRSMEQPMENREVVSRSAGISLHQSQSLLKVRRTKEVEVIQDVVELIKLDSPLGSLC